MGLTKAQRALLAQFQSVTGSSNSSAQSHLQAAGWNVDIAFNDYLDFGGDCSFNPPSSVDQAKISQLFDRYRDRQSPDVILAEGVEALCRDLQVDPADIVMLVISFYMDAEHSCEFTRKEFLSGMNKLECDSISKLKGQISPLRQQLRSPAKFQEIYTYAYSFSCERGQKCLQLEMAIAMWQLIFAQRPWPLLSLWCTFLQEHHKRAISKDTWTQLLEFVVDVKPDLSNFDENAATSAWPYLIDEFVEYVRSQKAGISEDDVIVID